MKIIANRVRITLDEARKKKGKSKLGTLLVEQKKEQSKR